MRAEVGPEEAGVLGAVLGAPGRSCALLGGPGAFWEILCGPGAVLGRSWVVLADFVHPGRSWDGPGRSWDPGRFWGRSWMFLGRF